MTFAGLPQTGRLLFLDTETGGLDPDEDELIEVTYAEGVDGMPYTLILPHRPWRVRRDAAELNGYYERDLADDTYWATEAERQAFSIALKGATLVGANPAFDAAFLRKHLGWQPWHHRMLDIESMAFVLGIRKASGAVAGLHEISEALRKEGIDVPAPDHTSRADVLATRACFYGLLGLSVRAQFADALADRHTGRA